MRKVLYLFFLSLSVAYGSEHEPTKVKNKFIGTNLRNMIIMPMCYYGISLFRDQESMIGLFYRPFDLPYWSGPGFEKEGKALGVFFEHRFYIRNYYERQNIWENLAVTGFKIYTGARVDFGHASWYNKMPSDIKKIQKVLVFPGISIGHRLIFNDRYALDMNWLFNFRMGSSADSYLNDKEEDGINISIFRSFIFSYNF